MKKILSILGGLIVAFSLRVERIVGYYNTLIINNPTGDAFISGKVLLQYPKHITVGSNSYINGGQLIASPNAYIKIGNNCLLSYNVHLRTDMHLYRERNVLIREQGSKEADIIIGNDVWIGYGAQIFGGVTLGDGCVIGAGAIITKDVMPYQVIVGNANMRNIGERE
ncbi:MAG: acyltransferase [Lachnospiraceae bacterium]|nr:acyltransferase [Lachnospiraceae bacterium]